MEADEKGMDQLSMNFYGDCSIYSTDIQFQVFVAALLKISKLLQIKKVLGGRSLKEAVDDQRLSLCWKGQNNQQDLSMEADEKGMDQLSMNFYGDCSIYSTDIQFQVFVAALLKISKETGKERLLVSVFELKQFANILGETFAEKKEQINNQIEIDRLSNLPEHMMLLQIKKVLGGRSLKEAVDDQRLSLCWKGRKPFKSIHDAKKYFKPLALSFTSGKTKILNELTPEAYLIISSKGNVCLGILNESEVGLQDLNLIGDILMQDRMVIYDNDKKLIRWIPANCDRPPKSKTMYM